MKRMLSMTTATFLWGAFIYMAIVAVTNFLPHFFSWDLDLRLVFFFMLDLVILEFLALLYQKLPHKPKNIAFAWLEKVSLFE